MPDLGRASTASKADAVVGCLVLYEKRGRLEVGALNVNRRPWSARRRVSTVLLLAGPLAVSLAWGSTPSAILDHARDASSPLAPTVPDQPGGPPGTCTAPKPAPDTWTTLVDESYTPPPFSSGIFLPSYQVVVDPWLPCLMYRATSAQDLERSLDSGTTWQRTFHDADPTVPGTSATSVPQANTDTCVAVSLNSPDCVPEPPTFAARDLQVPAAGRLVMAESGNGDAVLRSDDQGHGWYLADGGIEGRRIESVTPAPGHPEVLYAVVDSAGAVVSKNEGGVSNPLPPDPLGLYHSEDGGHTWAAAVPPPRRSQRNDSDARTQLQVDPADPAHLWLMVQTDICANGSTQTCAQIFESSDSGGNWQAILPASSSLTPVGNQFLVTRTDSHGLRLYLNSGLGRGFGFPTTPALMSQDDGLHWSPLPVPPLIVSSIAADPADPDTMVYTGSVYQGQQTEGNDVLTYFVTRDGWEHVRQGRGVDRGQSALPVSPLRNAGGTSERSIMIQGDRFGSFYLLVRDHSDVGGAPDRQRFLRLTPLGAPTGAAGSSPGGGGSGAGSASSGSGSGSSPSSGNASTALAMQVVGSCNLPISDGRDQEGTIAFDGDSLLYTKSLDSNTTPYTATIYRIDPRTCAPLPSLTVHFDPAAITQIETRYGAPPGSMRLPYVGDLAFDNGHDTIWMVLGGSAASKAFATSDSAAKIGLGSSENPVFSATLNRPGTATPADSDAVLRFFTPGGGDHSDVLDLFSYDYTDDTLWARGRVPESQQQADAKVLPTSTYPGHLDLDGRAIPSCWDQVNDYSSGGFGAWAVGAPGRLYVQSEDDRTVWEVDSSTCTTLRTYIHRNFGEPSAENEQMACDAISFGTGSEYARDNSPTSVLWLRDAVNQEVVAYAIPDGVCPIPTRTTYLGSTPSAHGDQTQHFCAQLRRRGTLGPIADRPMVFSIGGDRLGTGTTDSAGIACIDERVSPAAGVRPVLARFLGDTQYLPSQDSGVFGVPAVAALPPVVLGGLAGQGPPTSAGSSSQTAPVSETAPQAELQSQAQANAQAQAQSQAQSQANAMSQVQPGMMVERRSQQQVARQVAGVVQGQGHSLQATRLRQSPAQVILVGVLLGFGWLLRRPAASVALARRRPGR
jgi:hypothetical protein